MRTHIPDIPDNPETQQITPEILAMIEKFQCPGCLRGSNTRCGELKTENGQSCTGHVCGTIIFPVAFVAPGMPKGFCRPGFGEDRKPKSTMSFRFWTKGTHPQWDHLNVPVWALEQDGHLFVRTCLPRVAAIITDVIDGGTLALCPTAFNVVTILDNID